MLGGIIAGALGQGAQNVSDIAQQTIDVNNKQQLATFQSGLETERNAQAQRLAQTIGQENVMHSLSPEVVAAGDAAAASRQRSTALTAASPDVLSANDKVEASKPREMAPGGELHQTQPDGTDKVIAKSGVLTMAEMYEHGYRTSAGGANAAGKAAQFSAKEIDDGLTATTNLVEKGFTDPTTTKTPPELTNAASASYLAAIQRGAPPHEARVSAVRDATTLYGNAQAIMASEKYKAQVGGDFGKALRIAAALAGPAAAAPNPSGNDGAPAPAAKDPAATMGTTPPGIVNSARTPPAAPAAPAAPADDTPIPSFTAPRSQAASEARRAKSAAAAPVNDAKQSTDAQAAFVALKPGDARAASELQASPLFSYLTREQKAQISSLVNRGY